MAAKSTVFKDLKDLSADLQQKLNLLEFEVSDATKLLYDSDAKSNSDSKGITILQDVLEQHLKIQEELEKLYKSEQSDLALLNEELQTYTASINEHEKEQKKLEQILIEQNLILPEQSSLINDVSSGAEHDSEILRSSSPQPSPSCETTFLIPPLKLDPSVNQTPDSVNNDFQSTMCEFGLENSSSYAGKKNFVVKKN